MNQQGKKGTKPETVVKTEEKQEVKQPDKPVVPLTIETKKHATPEEIEREKERERAAGKIQAFYRGHLYRQDLQREKEIEQLLVDIDDLLAMEM